MAVVLKKKRELDLMRTANRIVAVVWEAMAEMVAPGVTTAQLDAAAERIIRQHGAIPSFKGYPHSGANDFPASICASINQEIVHGIPSSERVLREGDIISIDVGTIFRGYQGDGAITLPVGRVSEQALLLLDTTKGALAAGIAKARAGGRTSDISKAVQERKAKASENLGITRERVLREYACIAFSDPSQIYDEAGTLKNIHDIPEETRRAMAGLDLSDDGKSKIKLWDKKGALNDLGKHLGLFEPDPSETSRQGLCSPEDMAEMAVMIADATRKIDKAKGGKDDDLG